MTVSTTEIQNYVAACRNTASEARNGFAGYREAVQNDTRLSGFAKEQDISEARNRANAEIAAALERENAFLENSRQTLEQAAFGLGSTPDTADVVALRDATDRAEAVKGADAALELYEKARTIGDRTMLTALATRAYKTGMRKVLDHHIQNSPDQSRTFEALDMIGTLQNNASAQVAQGFAYVSASR